MVLLNELYVILLPFSIVVNYSHFLRLDVYKICSVSLDTYSILQIFILVVIIGYLTKLVKESGRYVTNCKKSIVGDNL